MWQLSTSNAEADIKSGNTKVSPGKGIPGYLVNKARATEVFNDPELSKERWSLPLHNKMGVAKRISRAGGNDQATAVPTGNLAVSVTAESKLNMVTAPGL